MFSKGNKYGRGRPAYALKSPEILLPGIFAKNNINWGADFCRLYRAVKSGKATKEENRLFRELYDLLPYLVTKINIKELDLDRLANKESAEAAKNQTEELVKLLEEEKKNAK
jgi:hypothetical protein